MSDTPSVTTRHADIPLAVACGLAVILSSYQTWLLNNGLFPTTSEIFPLAREAQTLAGILINATVLLIAMRRPSVLRPLPVVIGLCACSLTGAVMLAAAPGSAPLLTVGLVLRSIGGNLAYYLIGLAYTRLGPGKPLIASVSLGLLFATALTTFVPAPAFLPSVIVDVLVTAAIVTILLRAARPVASIVMHSEGSQVLALSSPASFLSPAHQLYVLILLFSTASGFALSLNISGFTPTSSAAQLVILAGVVVWYVLASGTKPREDALFAIVALLAVAGFLSAPLYELTSWAIPNSLLSAASNCFRILSWSVLAALCARNPVGSLLVLSCGGITSAAGTFMGADLGHLCNALLETQPDLASVITGAVVLALFAYVMIGLKGFSFSDTIRGVEPARPVEVTEPATPSRDEIIERNCDELARNRGLTDRERQVMGMLARGRNANHIQEELTLSYNTVKTHVKRIYRKLDVHSQQELIDLVEKGAPDAPGAGGTTPAGT